MEVNMTHDYKKAQKIVLEFCERWGIKQEWLTSGRKTRTIGRFRQLLIKELFANTQLSQKEVGLLVGLKGRATLSHN